MIHIAIIIRVEKCVRMELVQLVIFAARFLYLGVADRIDGWHLAESKGIGPWLSVAHQRSRVELSQNVLLKRCVAEMSTPNQKNRRMNIRKIMKKVAAMNAFSADEVNAYNSWYFSGCHSFLHLSVH